MVTKEICSNINSRCESVLQITDEAVQQTRTHCESNELMDEKISGNFISNILSYTYTL